MIKIACPFCAAGLKLSKPMPAGKIIKCPKCSKSFPVSAQPVGGARSSKLAAPAARRASKVAPVAPSSKKGLVFIIFIIVLALGAAGSFVGWKHFNKKTTAAIDNTKADDGEVAKTDKAADETSKPADKPADKPATPPTGPLDRKLIETYLAADFNGVAVLRPTALAKVPPLPKLPALREVLHELQKDGGIDWRTLAELVVLVEPFPAGAPKPGVLLSERPYTSFEGGFSVIFPPGQPRKGRGLAIGSGKTSSIVSVDLDESGKNVSFNVDWSNLDKDELKAGAQALLDSEGKDDKSVKERKAIKLGAHPGVELTCEISDRPRLERIYITETRKYKLMVAGAKKDFDPAQAVKFLDSFKLVELPPAKAGEPSFEDDSVSFFAGAIVRFQQPVDGKTMLAKFLSDKFGRLKPQEVQHAGKTYLRSTYSQFAGIFMAGFVVDEQTLLIAPETTLRKMLGAAGAAKSPLRERLDQLDLQADLSAVFVPDAYVPLLTQEIKQAKDAIPPPVAGLTALPDKIKAIALTIKLDGDPLLTLSLEMPDEASAKLLHTQAHALLTLGKQMYPEARKGLEPALPPAASKQVLQVADQLVEGVKIEKNAQRVVLALKKIEGLGPLVEALRPPPGKAKVVRLSLYSEKCVETLKKALEKVEGLADLAIDLKTRTATFTLSDRVATADAFDALDRAGFTSFMDVDPSVRIMRFNNVGMVLGGGERPKEKEVVLKRVHVCCKECEEVITKLFKDAKVTFDGEGPTKTVKIEGKDLDANAVQQTMQQAGFNFETKNAIGPP